MIQPSLTCSSFFSLSLCLSTLQTRATVIKQRLYSKLHLETKTFIGIYASHHFSDLHPEATLLWFLLSCKHALNHITSWTVNSTHPRLKPSGCNGKSSGWNRRLNVLSNVKSNTHIKNQMDWNELDQSPKTINHQDSQTILFHDILLIGAYYGLLHRLPVDSFLFYSVLLIFYFVLFLSLLLLGTGRSPLHYFSFFTFLHTVSLRLLSLNRFEVVHWNRNLCRLVTFPLNWDVLFVSCLSSSSLRSEVFLSRLVPCSGSVKCSALPYGANHPRAASCTLNRDLHLEGNKRRQNKSTGMELKSIQ